MLIEKKGETFALSCTTELELRMIQKALLLFTAMTFSDVEEALHYQLLFRVNQALKMDPPIMRPRTGTDF